MDLQLYLHRRNPRERDDILRVWRRGADDFWLAYTDGDTRRIYYHTYTKDAFRAYLWTLFYTLSVDADPFRYLQINVPGFPPTLLSVSDLDPASPTWSTALSLVYSFADGHWIATAPREPSRPSEEGEVSPSAHTAQPTPTPEG